MSTDDILTERLYNLEKQLEREKTMTDVKQPEDTEDEVVTEDTTEELDAEDEDEEDSDGDVEPSSPSSDKPPYRY